MRYNNLSRAGTRTTQTVNPQTMIPDVDEEVRSLAPEDTPLMGISRVIGLGPAPKTKKMQVMQHYEFDHYDRATSATVGSSTWASYAVLTLAQASRPYTNGSMFYYPQDRFILPTGQTAEVVMTPDSSYVVNGTRLSINNATLTGTSGAQTTCAAGTVVVRHINPTPLISFTSGDVIYTGRTIWESQPVEAISKQEDVLFDANFVEHAEEVLVITNDQKDFVKQYGKLNDLTFQQKETLKRFKKSIEYKLWFSERSVEFIQNNRPTYSTQGIIPAIKTNVQVYNPDSTEDFELLVANFMVNQAFRYSGKGGTTKVAYCGPRFLHNFDLAFREYRRSDLSDKSPAPGLNIQTYHWQGNTLKMVKNGVFRLGSQYENWCVVVDQLESKLSVAKDFSSFQWSLPNEREQKWCWEWQGGIRHNREETSSILRTA